MVEADQTVAIANTFAIVQSIALITMLAGVWAWALFMFKAQKEILVSQRELVLYLCQMKSQNQYRGEQITLHPTNDPRTFDPEMRGEETLG